MNEEDLIKYMAVAHAFYYMGVWSGLNMVKGAIPSWILGKDASRELNDVAEQNLDDAKKALETRLSGDFPDNDVWKAGFDAMYLNLDMYIKTGVWAGDIWDSSED